jgi:hypothetical protein
MVAHCHGCFGVPFASLASSNNEQLFSRNCAMRIRRTLRSLSLHMFCIVHATYKLATGPQYQFVSLRRSIAAEAEVLVYEYIDNA